MPPERRGCGYVNAHGNNELPTIGLSQLSGDFEINSGAVYTNQIQLPLSLSAQNANPMRISEDSSFADASYVLYDPQPTFNLSEGEGQQTIFVQLMAADDGTFNTEALEPYRDSWAHTLADPLNDGVRTLWLKNQDGVVYRAHGYKRAIL